MKSASTASGFPSTQSANRWNCAMSQWAPRVSAVVFICRVRILAPGSSFHLAVHFSFNYISCASYCCYPFGTQWPHGQVLSGLWCWTLPAFIYGHLTGGSQFARFAKTLHWASLDQTPVMLTRYNSQTMIGMHLMIMFSHLVIYSLCSSGCLVTDISVVLVLRSQNPLESWLHIYSLFTFKRKLGRCRMATCNWRTQSWKMWALAEAHVLDQGHFQQITVSQLYIPWFQEMMLISVHNKQSSRS